MNAFRNWWAPDAYDTKEQAAEDAFTAGRNQQREAIGRLIKRYSALNAEAIGLLSVDGPCDCSQCDEIRAQRELYSEFTAMLEILLES